MSPDTLKREDEIDKRADDLFNHPDHSELKELEKKAIAEHEAESTIAQEQAPPKFVSNVTGNSNTTDKRFGRIRGIARKSGPLGVIGLISLLGLFGIGFLTPGLAVMQLKEIFTEDLNDQLGAMDIRTTHVMKAKLNDMSKGALCTSISPAKCKFRGMSDRQIKKFESAGIKVEKDANIEKSLTGKNSVKKMTFSDGTQITNPAEAKRLLTTNRTVRAELRRAFNPKFAGMYDAISAKVLARYNTSKASKVTGNTDEERDKSLEKSAKEGTGSVDESRINSANPTDTEDGGKNYSTIDGDSVAEKAGNDAKKAASETSKNISAKAVAGGAFKSTLKGVQITGAVDTLCTVKNTARTVMAASKLIKKRQEIGYAMVFLNFADEVRAGTATPEQAEYIGDKVTAIDTQKKIVDESSTKDGENLKPRDNPYFGKNAFDSEGYKTSAYNDAPNLTSRANQFSIGGALSGTMANTLNTVGYKTPGKTTCKIIQNPAVRLGSAALGIFAGVVSFGATTAISVTASVAVGMALPYLEAYLADMISGNVVTKDTKGVDTGNAVFAGTAGLLGDVAMGRGMKPANKSDLKEYLAVSNNIKNEYIAMETDDAKATPLDITKKYSFLGSLTRKIMPSTLGLKSNIATLPFTGMGLLTDASESIFPNVSAASVWNEERFSKCDDEAYAELDIDADIFCNVRYSMSTEELNMETDDVIDFMTSKPEYLSEDGTPGEEYKEWLSECTERTAGWGETPEGQENGGEGDKCMSEDEKTKNFRVYTMDNSINEAMEYEGQTSTSSSDLKVMTYNVRRDALTNSNDRNELAIKTINEKQPGVIGFQEMDQVQLDAISKGLPQYSKTSDKLGDTRRIFWNSSMFTKVKEGSWNSAKTEGSNVMPWVELEANGTSFYVFNLHTQPGTGDENVSKRAADGAKLINEVIPNVTNNDGKAVIVTGDMNSGYPGHKGDRGTEFYSEFSKNNNFDLAINLASTKTNDDCETAHSFGKQDCGKSSARHIDHIYISKNVNATVSSWENIADDTTKDASDHNPVIADISIPGIGAGDDTSSPGGSIQGNDYSAECSSYKKIYSSICNKQCVSFVLFRLLKHKAIDTTVYGNGKDIAGALGKTPFGFTVNSTPAVNSVFSTSETSHPSLGHTGMVSKVNPDGSIEVEEYNYSNEFAYGTRTISKSEYIAKNFTFAHTETKYQ